MEELTLRPDALWAYCDLKEDFAYAKIPPGERQYYVEAGLAAGREQAKKYRNQNILSLLEKDGVEIRRFSVKSPAGLHSQICYDGRVRQIDIFTETAGELAETMKDTPWPVTQKETEQLFLAHEFYHWLEYSGRFLLEQQCRPVRIKILGIFSREIQIRRVSEIAAFSFTKEFCGLPVHPKMTDYLFMYRQKGKSFQEINEIFDKMEQEYRRECLQQ